MTDTTTHKRLNKSMVSCEMDEDLLTAVSKAAERRGISRSAFIRKALQRVIEGEPDAGA